MVINFLNLVDLKRFFSLVKDHERHIYFCDSVTLLFVLFLLRVPAVRISGISFFHSCKFSSETDFFLLATPVAQFDAYSCAVLPQFETDFDLDSSAFVDVIERLEKASPKRVFVGVSSPKQNILAESLTQRFPGVYFFCVGAAVYSNPIAPVVVGRFGLAWLVLLVSNPTRGFNKILKTIFSMFSLLVDKQLRSRLTDIKFEDDARAFDYL